MTLPPLHEAEMPLRDHPHWREVAIWWAWSGDDRLATRRRVVHRRGDLSHIVDALVTPEGVDVLHRTGPAPGLGAPPDRDPAAPGTLDRSTLRWTRSDGGVCTRDLLLSAGSTLPTAVLRFRDRATDPGGWPNVGLALSGIEAPDLPPGPYVRPLDVLPQRFELLLLVPGPEGTDLALIEQDASGTPLAGQIHRAGVDGTRDLALVDIEWEPGTRRARTVRLASDAGEIVVRSLCVLPGSLVGGLGSSWPIDGWIGDAASRQVRVGTDTRGQGLAGVQHEHLCAIEGIPGANRAILTVTALGAHEPSGLTGWTDPA